MLFHGFQQQIRLSPVVVWFSAVGPCSILDCGHKFVADHIIRKHIISDMYYQLFGNWSTKVLSKTINFLGNEFILKILLVLTVVFIPSGYSICKVIFTSLESSSPCLSMLVYVLF